MPSYSELVSIFGDDPLNYNVAATLGKAIIYKDTSLGHVYYNLMLIRDIIRGEDLIVDTIAGERTDVKIADIRGRYTRQIFVSLYHLQQSTLRKLLLSRHYHIPRLEEDQSWYRGNPELVAELSREILTPPLVQDLIRLHVESRFERQRCLELTGARYIPPRSRDSDSSSDSETN